MTTDARSEGTIIKVSGPLVVARGLAGSRMFEMVRVGRLGLMGEIIEIRGDEYSIQVYEETEDIAPGQPVAATGAALSVDLGPGLMRSIYDGVQRPLDKIMADYGLFIERGAVAAPLDEEKKWAFTPVAKAGAAVKPGDILGTVPETPAILHKVMVPPGVEGALENIAAGDFTVKDTVAVVVDAKGVRHDVRMAQRWPVRSPRPTARKLPPVQPLLTGQRVIDMFFPVAKGGTACVPGPFGSGKTVVQHALAKWADADIIVFIGCGERGNEMTDVLLEFPELIDPKSGRPLMDRTILIANTSNMPVAAREASVFTGITIAEYYRDMGYSVALMADSTSRWAEAMREMSGRLEEMPGDEGYPAYLGSRIAAFYERAGMVRCLGADERTSSLTVIGAVSPAGGDLSEPVTQATLRVVKVFWSLDDQLAFQRHFPAINWLNSYSLYQPNVDEYADKEITGVWSKQRREAMGILKRESDLQQLVQLVGMDSLSPTDRLLMEAARMIREDFLHQNAFDDIDTYTSMKKQALMLGAILAYYRAAEKRLAEGGELAAMLKIPAMEPISRAKLILEKDIDAAFPALQKQIEEQIAAVR